MNYSNIVESYRAMYDSNLDELYKGKHGQSETEYQDSRSDAGKRTSGDSKSGPVAYTRRNVAKDKPTPVGARPINTPRLANWEKDDMKIRKNSFSEGVKKIDRPTKDDLEAIKNMPLDSTKRHKENEKAREYLKNYKNPNDKLTHKQQLDQANASLRKEDIDCLEIILSHLLDEGYVNDIDGAEAILLSMSEAWMNNILISERVSAADVKFAMSGRLSKRADELADAIQQAKKRTRGNEPKKQRKVTRQTFVVR